MKFNQNQSFGDRERFLKYFNLKEIELVFSRGCNLSCSFCPQSNTNYVKKFSKGFLEKKVLIKLINDLNDKNIFYEIAGFGEPFLHPEFKELIKILDRIQNGYFTIITNGILFKKNFKDYYSFFKNLKHLKEIKVSCYTKDILHFFGKKKIPWITVKKINTELFNNRAGSISTISTTQSDNQKYSSCNYPFFFLTIDTNGDILPCPHEWEKRLTLGNILNQDINEIWNSDKINKIRSIMINKERQSFYPCDICTAPGTLIGNKAKEDYEKRQNTKT